MNRAVVISDTHLHPFEAFSHIDPTTGLNSRLLDGFSALKQVKDYCIQNKIQHLLNGGDLLHKGATVSVDLLELLIKELVDFKANGIEIISIVGQHDFLKKDGSYNLPKALSDLMIVLNEPGEYVDIDGTRIIGCSYRYGLQDQKQALAKCKNVKSNGQNILLGHFLVRELLEQNSAPFDTSSYVAREDMPKVQMALLGDYHYHVASDDQKIVSIGALMQHQWGDKNRPQGGFLDLDCHALTFKRVEVDAPMFVEVEANEKFPNGHDPKHFYKIRVKDQKKEDRLRASLDDGWRCSFEMEVEEEARDEDEPPRLQLDIASTPENILREYCQYMGQDDAVLKKGLEFL